MFLLQFHFVFLTASPLMEPSLLEQKVAPYFEKVRKIYPNEPVISDDLQHHLPPGVMRVQGMSTLPGSTCTGFIAQVKESFTIQSRLKQKLQIEMAKGIPELSQVEAHIPLLFRKTLMDWVKRLEFLNSQMADRAKRRLVDLSENDSLWTRLHTRLRTRLPHPATDLGLVQSLRGDFESEAIRVIQNSKQGGVKGLGRPLDSTEEVFLSRLSIASEGAQITVDLSKALEAIRFIEFYSKADHSKVLEAFSRTPLHHPRWKTFMKELEEADLRNYLGGLAEIVEATTQNYFAGSYARDSKRFGRPVTEEEQFVFRSIIREGGDRFYVLWHWLRRVEDLDPSLYQPLLESLKKIPANHSIFKYLDERLQKEDLAPDVDLTEAKKVIDLASVR